MNVIDLWPFAPALVAIAGFFLWRSRARIAKRWQQWRLDVAAARADRRARLIAPGCPTCGNKKPATWKPDRDYCADCGRGVRVGADPAMLVHMLETGQIDETQFTTMGLASGMNVREIASLLIQLEQLRDQGLVPDRAGE